MRLLLVEDTEDVAWPIRVRLAQEGHAVDLAATLDAAREHAATTAYDLIILDLNLPDGSGLELLREVRADGRAATAVLVLTARDMIEDRVAALDLGADDYLVKPFDVRELSARVRALLRRRLPEPVVLHRLGELAYDPALQRVTVGDDLRELHLTRRELSLLDILVTHRQRALSKEEIYAKLFRLDEDSGLNAVELYVARLRRKLSGTGVSIRTQWGHGYRIVADES